MDGSEHEDSYEDTNAQVRQYQKNLANAEADRKCFAGETQANIKKQHTKIDNLRNESHGLREYIAKVKDDVLMKTHSYNMNSKGAGSTQTYKWRIEAEEEKFDKICKDIDIIEKQIVVQKRSIGGVNAGQDNQNSLVKQIKILENRLDKANQKFNEAISVNKSLRQQIDSLRRERVIFDNLYKKLEKELHNKRKKMAGIIETANNAYEARDRANNEIESLKDQAKREAEDFQTQLKDLAQLAETNRKAKEFANMASENKRDEYGRETESEKNLKARNQRLLKETAIDPHLEEEYNKLRLDYCKIEAATQIEDFEVLIKNFVEMEESNFNLFKYVVDLSNGVETLENQIKEYKEEKKLYEGSGGETTVKKNKYLKTLDSDSINSRNKTDYYSSKCSSAQKTLDCVKQLVQTLSTTLMCDTGSCTDINKNEGVTESNILAYMSMIEDRFVSVITAYMLARSNDNKDGIPSFGRSFGDVGHRKEDMNQEMPSLDESGYTDENTPDAPPKPLTYEQLRVKAEEFLANGGQKKKGYAGKSKSRMSKHR